MKKILRLKKFFFVFLKSKRSQLSNALRFVSFGQVEKKSTLLGPSAILPNFEPFWAIFHNFWKFWNLIVRLKKILRLKKFFLFVFEKYTISAFKRTSIRVFWTSRKKKHPFRPKCHFTQFWAIFGLFLCDFMRFFELWAQIS